MNPATNSDSDSTKSNGARVVSPSIHIRMSKLTTPGSIVNSMIFTLNTSLVRSCQMSIFYYRCCLIGINIYIIAEEIEYDVGLRYI